MLLLWSRLAAFLPPEVYGAWRPQPTCYPPATTAPRPSGVRGAALSHRDWIAADSALARLRERGANCSASWTWSSARRCRRRPFRTTMSPTTRGHRIDGKAYPYSTSCSGPGVATSPAAGDRRADRPIRTGCRSACRSSAPSRGPHDHPLRRAVEREFGGFRAPAWLRRLSLAKRAPARLARSEVRAGSLPRAAVARQAGCGIVHRDPMREVRAPFPQNEIVVPVWSSTTRERLHQ